MSDNDNFFDPEYIDRDFSRNSKTKTFRVRELTGEEADKLFDIRDRSGKGNDPAKLKGLDSRLIATAVTEVTEAGPVSISAEQAGKLPAKLRKELTQLVMEVNGMSETAADTTEAD